MKKTRKAIYVLILLLLLTAASAWYYVFIWSSHHRRNIEDERGIAVSAASLVEIFEKSEQGGNAAYLDKAVEITGEISSVSANQSGKQTILLKSNDPMSGVFCTLQNKYPMLKVGDAVTVKGICTGYLSDVIIIDAIIIKSNNATSK